MVNITTKTLSTDALITANNSVEIPSLKDRLYTICNQILPTFNYWDSTTTESTYSNLYNGLKPYMCSRADLLSNIASILDTDTSVSQNKEVISTSIYEIIKKVFVELGRCKRVVLKNVEDNGTQVLPKDLNTAPLTTKWVYFSKAFTFSNDYTSNVSDLPPKQNNSNTNNTKFSSDPLGSVGWNNNTTYTLNSAKVSTLSVNKLITAVRDVETQIERFKTDSNSVNNSEGMWNGSYSNPNGSNKITFVRYWCHSNCHCHSSGRSRR